MREVVTFLPKCTAHPRIQLCSSHIGLFIGDAEVNLLDIINYLFPVYCSV
jgi:hypothetical protein